MGVGENEEQSEDKLLSGTHAGLWVTLRNEMSVFLKEGKKTSRLLEYAARGFVTDQEQQILSICTDSVGLKRPLQSQTFSFLEREALEFGNELGDAWQRSAPRKTPSIFTTQILQRETYFGTRGLF